MKPKLKQNRKPLNIKQYTGLNKQIKYRSHGQINGLLQFVRLSFLPLHRWLYIAALFVFFMCAFSKKHVNRFSVRET